MVGAVGIARWGIGCEDGAVLRTVLLPFLAMLLACGPPTAIHEPEPPPPKRQPALAAMLPEGATGYAQADDVQLLVKRAAGERLARSIPPFVTRAAFATYADEQRVAVLQTDRPDEAKFGERYQRVGTTPGGAAHYREEANPFDPQEQPRQLLWYADRGTAVAAPASMVGEIDAVVAGTKPSLSVPEGLGLVHGFTTKTVSLIAGRTLFSLVDTPRLAVEVRAPLSRALPPTSVVDILRRLPSDTIAFEAHAMPKDVMAELIVPWGQGLIEERFGIDVGGLLKHVGGRAVIGAVADTPQDTTPMEQLFDRGLVFLIQEVDEAADAQRLLPDVQKKVANALGKDEVQTTDRGFVVALDDGGDRVLSVEIIDQHVWVSAGPSELSTRVRREVFSGQHNFQRKAVLDALSNASFGLWVDRRWLDQAADDDAFFIRHGDGEALTSARVTGTLLSATIDAAMVEDLLRILLRWGMENIVDSIEDELIGD